jgi:hypothetical protein
LTPCWRSPRATTSGFGSGLYRHAWIAAGARPCRASRSAAGSRSIPLRIRRPSGFLPVAMSVPVYFRDSSEAWRRRDLGHQATKPPPSQRSRWWRTSRPWWRPSRACIEGADLVHRLDRRQLGRRHFNCESNNPIPRSPS